MSLNDAPLSSAGPAVHEGEPYRFDQWRMRLLERAAESAVAVLETITRDVQTGGGMAEGDVGLTYSRFAKALRQALALHAKFEEDSLKTEQERTAEAAARQAAEAQHAAAIQTRDKKHKARLVKQAVVLAMKTELAEDAENYHGAYRNLIDRLDDFDDYSDCGRKPVGEIVESICKVMGLKFDPALWEDEPWAIEEAEAETAASPAADWPHTANDDDDRDPDQERDDEQTDPYGIATGTGPP